MDSNYKSNAVPVVIKQTKLAATEVNYLEKVNRDVVIWYNIRYEEVAEKLS